MHPAICSVSFQLRLASALYCKFHARKSRNLEQNHRNGRFSSCCRYNDLLHQGFSNFIPTQISQFFIEPLTVYACLTNGNKVFVTIFAYFILGETINKFQIATLCTLIIFATMTAISTNPYSAPSSDMLKQEQLGKSSMHTITTVIFLVTLPTTFPYRI